MGKHRERRIHGQTHDDHVADGAETGALWMTFNRPETSADHADAHRYLRARAAQTHTARAQTAQAQTALAQAGHAKAA